MLDHSYKKLDGSLNPSFLCLRSGSEFTCVTVTDMSQQPIRIEIECEVNDLGLLWQTGAGVQSDEGVNRVKQDTGLVVKNLHR